MGLIFVLGMVFGAVVLLVIGALLSVREDRVEARKTRENTSDTAISERLKAICGRLDDAFRRIGHLEAHLYGPEGRKNPPEAQKTRENTALWWVVDESGNPYSLYIVRRGEIIDTVDLTEFPVCVRVHESVARPVVFETSDSRDFEDSTELFCGMAEGTVYLAKPGLKRYVRLKENTE